MRRTAHTFGLVILGVALAGCAASPWSASKPASATANAPAAQPAPGAAAAPPGPAIASAGQPDPQAMQRVMAEVQQLGGLDKAAQDKLMEDLKQTDPSLWPLMLQQFRAVVAYRRQAEQREMAAAAGNGSPQGPPGSAPPWSPQSPPGPVAQRPDAPGQSGAPPGQQSPAVRQLPPPNDAALAPGADDPASRVVQASYDPAAADWQAHLAMAIRALEAEVSKSPQTQEEVARHVRLRILYLLAGRREAAVQPIPAVAEATQEFWSKEIYGLATWLDTQRNPDTSRRAAETKRILDEAVARLGESAPLVVKNLAFCSEVHSYGCVKQFKTSEFAPDQEVLLYAEVENLGAETTPKGFHTKLRSSYQIFDARGQRVAEHDFTVTEEHCQNQRRDFFIGYHVRLPSRIYPGKHTLQLTIEDLNSQKVGQSTIELTIKDAAADRKR